MDVREIKEMMNDSKETAQMVQEAVNTVTSINQKLERAKERIAMVEHQYKTRGIGEQSGFRLII